MAASQSPPDIILRTDNHRFSGSAISSQASGRSFRWMAKCHSAKQAESSGARNERRAAVIR